MNIDASKRRVLLMALGVHDGWDPLVWFKDLKTELPLARILGLAMPTRTSPETAERWFKEPRAKLGLYGWHGTAYEAFGWTLGEAYFKLRDAFERAQWDPFFFPPDASMSDEALAMLSEGGDPHFPKLNVVGDCRDMLGLPKGIDILTYVGSNEMGVGDHPVGLFVSNRTDLQDFKRNLVGSTGLFTFTDPAYGITQSIGEGVHDLEIVKYVPE